MIGVLQPGRPLRIAGPRTEPDGHRLAHHVLPLDGMKPLEPDVLVIILDEGVVALDVSVAPDDGFAIPQVEQMPESLSIHNRSTIFRQLM